MRQQEQAETKDGRIEAAREGLRRALVDLVKAGPERHGSALAGDAQPRQKPGTELGMIPKTAAEMTGLVHIALLTRIYGDVTTAARRGRLTEDAIATIERGAIATLGGADHFANEFKTFQAEVAVAEAVKITRELLASVLAGRERQIRESP